LQQLSEKTAVLSGKDEVLCMKSAKILIITVLGVLTVSVASTRGQTLDLTGATLFGGPITGQTLFDSGTGANDGIISSWAINDPTLNPSGLIFIYQLKNSGPDDVTGINFNNYTHSQYVSSASYSSVINGSLPGALTPTVTLSPNFTFDTVTGGGAATFNGDLAMGAVSWFVAIDTDVTADNTGYALTQDDFQTHGDILAPNFAVFGVPEPSSAVLLLAGFACFYGILRCRRAME
jgi:hypothetical protein